jgi:hypothetical protein
VRPIDLRDRFEQAGPKSRVGKRHLRFKVEVDIVVGPMTFVIDLNKPDQSPGSEGVICASRWRWIC